MRLGGHLTEPAVFIRKLDQRGGWDMQPQMSRCMRGRIKKCESRVGGMIAAQRRGWETMCGGRE